MTDRFRVVWAESAERDLGKIITYRLEHQPEGSLESLNALKTASSQLYHFPERDRVVPELQSQGIYLFRELIVPPSRLIYRISEKTVVVLTVFDSRQSIDDVILSRILGEIQ